MPESLKRLPPKECFPKMISYLAHEYPDKEHDQIVAIAASECGVSKKDTYGMDIGIQAALFLAHYKEKYPYLNVKDQLRLSYQNLKLTNDFYDSFQIQSLDTILLQVAEDFEDSNKIKEAYDIITDACLLLPDDKRMEIASKWYDFRTSEKEEGKEFKCDLFWDFVAYNMYDFIEDVVIAEIQTTDFEIEVNKEEFLENRINDFIDIIVYSDVSPSDTVKKERKEKLAKAFETMRSQKKKKDFVGDTLDECLSYYKKEGKDEVTSKKICFASMNKAQIKATEKAKEKVYWKADISVLKKKLDTDDRRKLEWINKAIEDFPKKGQGKDKPHIIIVDKIPDHPNWKEKKNQTPIYYQEVGINRTYEEVPGSYSSYRNECIISLKNNSTPYNAYRTTLHEIAHSIWYYGNIPLHLSDALEYETRFYKAYIKDKYYHSTTEMFALLFETRDKKEFMRQAEIENEYIAQRFFDIYLKLKRWAEE